MVQITRFVTAMFILTNVKNIIQRLKSSRVKVSCFHAVWDMHQFHSSKAVVVLTSKSDIPS